MPLSVDHLHAAVKRNDVKMLDLIVRKVVSFRTERLICEAIKSNALDALRWAIQRQNNRGVTLNCYNLLKNNQSPQFSEMFALMESYTQLNMSSLYAHAISCGDDDVLDYLMFTMGVPMNQDMALRLMGVCLQRAHR